MNNTKLTDSETTLLLEVARIALHNKPMCDHIMDELDINEDELDSLQDKVDEITSSPSY
jgi:hypothetical protein